MVIDSNSLKACANVLRNCTMHSVNYLLQMMTKLEIELEECGSGTDTSMVCFIIIIIIIITML